MEASLERAGYTDVSRLGAGSFGAVFLGRKTASSSCSNGSSNGTSNGACSGNATSGGEGDVVALKRLTGNTAPYRVVLEMQLLQQAARGSEFIPALLGGFRDAVFKRSLPP